MEEKENNSPKLIFKLYGSELKDPVVLADFIIRQPILSQDNEGQLVIQRPIGFICYPTSGGVGVEEFWRNTKAAKMLPLIGGNYIKARNFSEDFVLKNEKDELIMTFKNAVIPTVTTNLNWEEKSESLSFEFFISGSWFDFHEESNEGKFFKETYDKWMQNINPQIELKIRSEF